MKKTLSFALATCISLCALAASTSATANHQDSLPAVFDKTDTEEVYLGTKEILILVYAGMGLNQPIGTGPQDYRNQINELEASSPEGTSLRGYFTPGLVPLAGFKAGLALGPRLYAGTGFQFSQRSYRAVYKYTYEDPEYQYDEYTKESAKLRYGLAELPVWGRLAFNEKFHLELGALLGFALKKKATKKYRFENEVVINGEANEDYSSPMREGEASLEKALQGFQPSAYVALYWRLFDQFQWGMSGQYALHNSFFGSQQTPSVLLTFMVAYSIN